MFFWNEWRMRPKIADGKFVTSGSRGYLKISEKFILEHQGGHTKWQMNYWVWLPASVLHYSTGGSVVWSQFLAILTSSQHDRPCSQLQRGCLTLLLAVGRV